MRTWGTFCRPGFRANGQCILSPGSPCFLPVSSSNPSIFPLFLGTTRRGFIGTKQDILRRWLFSSTWEVNFTNVFRGSTFGWGHLTSQTAMTLLHHALSGNRVLEVANQISDANYAPSPPLPRHSSETVSLWVNISSLKPGHTVCPSSLPRHGDGHRGNIWIIYFIVNKQ